MNGNKWIEKQIENQWNDPEFRQGWIEAGEELEKLGYKPAWHLLAKLEKDRLKDDPEAEV